MSLLVDLEKDFGSFSLKVSFETEGGTLGFWAPRAAANP